jgi:hypothetical protein
VIDKYPNVFKPAYIKKTKKFYEQYGGKTVAGAYTRSPLSST